MASIDEIVAQFQSVLDKVDEAIGSADAAESDADEMQHMFAAAGVNDKVEQLAAVNEATNRLRQHLQGGKDLADECINLTKAVGG